MMIAREFPPSCSARRARSAGARVLAGAGARGLGRAGPSAVAARFDEAIEAGHGEEDMAAVYEAAKPRP